jgi:hypothetical protein
MDTNVCPRCGRWLFADRTCRCGWPKVKARLQQVRVPVLRRPTDRRCAAFGCEGPARVGKLCWRHYRQLRKQVPANRRKGLGCYRGMPRKLIEELASLNRASKHAKQERLRAARELIFDRAGGRIMNLTRDKRFFVNRVSHESHERYVTRCWDRGIAPMSFRAYRRRWYGAQKVNWRRFDVPREIRERL